MRAFPARGRPQLDQKIGVSGVRGPFSTACRTLSVTEADPRAVERAMAHVGRTAETRARWLLEFASYDLTPLQWRILQMEVDFFIFSEPMGRNPRMSRRLGGVRFPPEEFAGMTPMIKSHQIHAWHRWLHTGIKELTSGHVWQTPIAVTHQLQIGSPLSLGITRSIEDLFRGGTIEAFKQLWPRLRRCKRCGALFVARKRQAYCSPRCSQAVRTKRYRSRDPERVRRLRRSSYERRQRNIHGQKVKVGRRIKTPFKKLKAGPWKSRVLSSGQ